MPTFTMVGALFFPAEAKDIIKCLHGGDIVDLVADPDNEYDSTAVRVERDGVHIGFIPATDNSAAFAILIDGGELTGEVVAFESTLRPIIEYELNALSGQTEDDDFGTNWGDD